MGVMNRGLGFHTSIAYGRRSGRCFPTFTAPTLTSHQTTNNAACTRSLESAAPLGYYQWAVKAKVGFIAPWWVSLMASFAVTVLEWRNW